MGTISSNYMSTATGYPIEYSEPRTIWTLTLQLTFTLLAMLPFYYYLRNIAEIPADGRYLLQFLPIAVGILLFFLQQYLNTYYWRKEKIYKRRDMFVVGLQSYILSIWMFYTIYLLLFGYFIGQTDAYDTPLFSDIITRTMIQLLISLGTIALFVLAMRTAQEDNAAPRKFTNRFRRG